MSNPLGRTSLLATIAACLLAAGALAGCDRPEARLKPIFAAAGNPAQGRGAAAQDLAQQIIAGRLTIADAIDDAVARIDAAAAAGQPSTNETIYAGAVLDAAAIAEDSLPQGGEFEFLWIKLGRLAFIAAEEAHAHDRVAEAMTIVLAGPQRWQTEPYWLRYSDHDALAAVVLAKSGRAPEAVLRLQSRPVLDGPALEVYQMLTGTGGE